MKPFFNNIKTKLTICFILISVIPLIVFTVITYNQRSGSIKKRESVKLQAIRDLKVKQIENWIDERISDIKSIGDDIERRDLENIFYNKNTFNLYPKIYKNISSILQQYKGSHEYWEEISLLNPMSGKVEISTDKFFEGQIRRDELYYKEPKKNRHVYLTSIYYSKRLNKPSMVISIPFFCKSHNKKHIVGIIIGRIDIKRLYNDLLLDRTGLGETGETLILNRNAIALSDLRGHENAPLSLKLNTICALNSSKGQTGIIESTDYRNEKVLVAYTYIPKTRWGFITKQDLDEIYKPIYSMLIDFTMLFLVSVLGVYFVAKIIANALSRPILEMTKNAEKIQKGNLSARNKIITTDELGFLSKAINDMADFMLSQIEIRYGNAEIIKTLATADKVTDFRKELLQKLIKITNSNFGAYYMLNKDDGKFHHFTSVGLNPEALKSFDSKTNEGAFGKAIMTKKIDYDRQIPGEIRFVYKSIAGDITPREIITIPIVIEKDVRGIISLGKIDSYSNQSIEIINQTWHGINNAISNLLSHIETQMLAKKLNTTNLKLLAQSDKLQSQAERLEKQAKELRRQNIKLEFQKKEVEHANRMKSEFLSNMSHELRTPLNSILALSRVLIRQTNNNITEEETNYLKIIDRNGKNLLALINDILDLSKIEAGKIDITKNRFSLSSILNSIIESMEPMIGEKKLEIVQEFEDLPYIESDEKIVSQIFQNIIGNAVKFTEMGSVKILAHSDDDNIFIEIIDTGIGIEEKDIPFLFNEFWQVDGSHARRFDGTGLGLAISYKLAKLINSDITVKSEVNKGSVFCVRIPIEWDEKREFSKPAKTSIPQKRFQVQKTVLIVDDNIEVVNLISEYLNQEGYKTISADSGAEAIKIAKKEKPFAITLDIFMPDMDGWEVLQKLKEDVDTSQIPVIIVSVSDDTQTGSALGAIGYVNKPIKKERLLDEIENAAILEKKTILIVDDNETDLQEMVQMIETSMNTLIARNGKECLDTLESIIPDMVILDLTTPQMDGFDTLKKIRENPDTAHIPAIIITTKDLTENYKKRLSGNISSIVQKRNLSVKTLLHEIKKILVQKDPDNITKQDHVELPSNIDGKYDNKNSHTVLIIEDNPDNMITVKAILQNKYTLLEAPDGETGLELISCNKPDLVLLDIALPKITGFEVIRRVRENQDTRDIPVIAMTAYAMKGDKDKLIESGCDDYISKPLDPDDLLVKIDKLIYGEETQYSNLHWV